MTRDEIVKMAEEAGAKFDSYWGIAYNVGTATFERFAALVAAAEREACAQLALQGTGEAVQTKTLEILQSERQRIAAVIRARGEK